MNQNASIVVNRYPYEEPYHTQLEFEVSNGGYGGTVDFYCGVDEIREMGLALMAFPSKVPDEYRFVYGSDDPAQKFYRFFQFRAYTIDLAGHCALQFTMDLNKEAPDEGRCCFSIRAEPAQINRLGRLFVRLYERAPAAFRWDPYSDEFIDDPGRGSQAV